MPGVKRTNSKPAELSDAAELIRAVARDNIDAFIQTQFKVLNFAGKEVNFNYKHGQRVVAAVLAQYEKDNKPAHIYVLKSRQIGLTTQTANRNFVKIWSNNNRRAVTVAHREKRASEILGKLRFAYTKLPEFLRFELAQDSKHELGFADFNSKMFIVSGESMSSIELARGDTVQDVHASELTRWGDPEGGLVELQNVCHAVEANSFVIETTGRLYGSYGHTMWKNAKAKKNQYRAIFLKWQDDPECDLDAGTWTDEERDRYMREVHEQSPQLIEWAGIHGLKPGNIYWAFIQFRDVCLSNWEKFLEDFPCTDEEAWRSKGDTYFEGNQVLKLLKKTEDVPVVGFMLNQTSLEDGFRSFGELHESIEIDIDDEAPHVLLWKLPSPERRYVVSGDSGGGSAGGDPSSSFVIDMYTGEMMAEFHGLVKPHQHAKIIESLGTIYNYAIAAPEVNSMGMATLQDLMRTYPNIFIWRAFDDNKQRLTNKLGWYTGTKSRGLMLALLSRVVEEAFNDNVLCSGTMRSIGVLNEMRTFLDDPVTGKPQAQSGCHDDRIIALAIAWMVAQFETRGSQNDILSVLRPRELQEGDAGLMLARNLEVKDVIEQVKKSLRMKEY